MTRTRLVATVAAISTIALTLPAVAQETPLPEYYPDNYGDIIEASRGEDGLVVYSNMAENNWAPAIEGFQARYPWIAVETLDLGSGTVHSRWEAEAGSDSRSADLLVSGSNDRWASYGVKGTLMDYQSPELAYIGDFARPWPGVFVLSTDPMLIVYNAAILAEDERPTGFSSMVELAVANPDTFDGRLTTYDPGRSSFGLSIWYYVMRAKGDAGWAQLGRIGKMIRGETSGGAMNEKITTGEYVAGYNISGITIFPRLEQAGGQILGFAFPEDGTPLMLRGIGIPREAANPNSAMLFFDYLMSQEGQTRLGQGGLVPHRADVDEADVRYTYQAIQEIVGEDNLILVGYDEELIAGAEAFAERFGKVLGGH